MASIREITYPSGKKRYRVRIRRKGAPGYSKTCPSQQKANDWACRKEAEILEGRDFGKKDERKRTFDEFIDRYIERELPKNPKSFSKLKMQLLWWKKHLKSYFLSRITPQMISSLKSELLDEKTPRGDFRSQSTANRYIAALSRAFTIAVREWGWLKENPLSNVTRFREGKPRDRYLSKDEISLLLAACKNSKSTHLYPFTLFALCSGARKGEILGLKWRDIDFDRGTVTFRNTKNGDDRTVPISETLVECLKGQREKRIVFSEYVFPSLDGKKPASITTAWNLAVKETGIEGISIHTLRHTAASHLAMGGASTLEIAAILGHKTLAMVKRYSHFSISATAKVLKKMNEEILRKIC